MGEPIPIDAANTEQGSVSMQEPVVRPVSVEDMAEAFAQGVRDFQNAPVYGLVFGALFALGGLAIAACAHALGLSYLMYPFVVGFAMIGPFAAIGLYEVSRLRETGAPLSWRAVVGTVVSHGGRELAWLAFVILFIFMAWIYAAQMLVALFFGLRSFSSQADFVTMVTTTPQGWLFLLVGNLLGAATLFVTFSLTVVSVPLLLDRDVDFVTAMITSLRAVAASPGPMLGWAAMVFILLVVASVPAFLGLLIAVPVLGHATWRLYRKIVVFPEN
jgi:uncharacterized membrane protein